MSCVLAFFCLFSVQHSSLALCVRVCLCALSSQIELSNRFSVRCPRSGFLFANVYA